MLKRLARCFADEIRGVAHIEFALTLPLICTIAYGVIQWASMAYVQNQVQSLASIMADNAARMRQGDGLGAAKVRESDILEIITAANLQSSSIAARNRRRFVISSLEQNANGGQWIHWQRCYGNALYSSSFLEGVNESGTAYPGAEINGVTIAAPPGSAVMLTEVVIDYMPPISIPILGIDARRFTSIAASPIRGSRNLSDVIRDRRPALCS